MEKDLKDLLMRDLCGRLPYHVKVKVWLEDGTTEEGALDLEHNYADVLLDAFYYNKIKDIKPYLFPLSSMTEEQRKEWLSLMIKDSYGILCPTIESFDYLYKNHIDIRGFISMGLANDATGLNIY